MAQRIKVDRAGRRAQRLRYTGILWPRYTHMVSQ